MSGTTWLVTTLLTASLLAAPCAATPQSTLVACQKALGSEGKKFIHGYVGAVSSCLQKVAGDVVFKGLPGPSAGAAAACMAQYRKIHDTRGLGKSLTERLRASVGAACAPSEHTLADVLGSGAGVPEPLNAGDLGAYCAGVSFGGDGALGTVDEWADCVVAAHTCAARAALASQFPRLLQWTAALSSAMAALTPPPNDATRVADALAGLLADDAAIEGGADDDRPDISCGGPPARPLRTGDFAYHGPGSDAVLKKGIRRAYVDNGDGTVSDLGTGLMWEKKGLDGGVHDGRNTYTWSSGAGPMALMDGTISTVFLDLLNARCDGDAAFACSEDAHCTVPGGPGGRCGFAGYRDWRIPNINELLSLAAFGEASLLPVELNHPWGCFEGCAIRGPASCSCPMDGWMWSSTSEWGGGRAWALSSDYYPSLSLFDYPSIWRARAVRGGY